MTSTKKIVAFLLVAYSIIINVCAATSLEPNEVIKEQSGELQIIKKVYVLPKEQNADVIPKVGFTENEKEYSFNELLTQDNSEEEIKEYSETISIHTNTSNTKTVISKFEPTIEVSTEEGFAGTLEFDYTTLNVTASGYGKENYTIIENRSYPNLMDADTSFVPKTIEKDGNILNLTNISWQSTASDNIDGQDLAVRYTANATYSGTGTKTYTKGYTATAEYKGEVKRIANDTITYTAVFIETPKEDANHLKSYWWAYLLGLIGLGGGGYSTYRLIRKRKAGY